MSFLARCVPLVAGLMLLSSPSAKAIEAQEGKDYPLTKRHGPWMIMVASFKEPPPERRGKGLTPEQAAHKLVYELRKEGIPAYVYSQDASQLIAELQEQGIPAYARSKDEVRASVETVDLMGRVRTREYTAKQKSYCVLAGNYESNDETTKGGKLAKDTLAWIENRFEPEFLTVPDPNFERAGAASKSQVRKLKSGGIMRLTPGKLRQGKGPLAGAFLTLNPLLSPDEVQSRKQDPLLLKLNAGNELSLYDNPGKYTLVVASFYGKSSNAQVGVMGMENFREAQRSFKAGDALVEAAENAWEVATRLRRGYFVTAEDSTKRPAPKAYESWIWHDRFKSVVTVGSFDSLEDPRIAEYQRAFGAKIKEHAQTKKPFLAAEQLTVPAVLQGTQLPEKSWIFDPNPQLVEVPRLRK